MALQHENWGYEDHELFQHYYRCYPVSKINRSNLENGDKIIMPPSALSKLVNLHMEYPMLFELRNPSAERATHCGVLEFIADEGTIYIPNWMMENMCLKEGDTGSEKCQPCERELCEAAASLQGFSEYLQPKSHTSLRNYSCLTTGDTIMLAYNNKKYYIDVVETKPSPAVSIIETDCEVDFAQPLDYEEPKKQLPPAALDKEIPEDEDVPAAKKPRITPFSGSARRLDGKPSTQSVEQTLPSMLKQQQQTENATKSCNRASGRLVFGSNANTPKTQTANATKSSNRASGKLVFGSHANTPKTQTQPKASLKSTSQESSQKAEEPKFQAFSGKKYTLS